MRDSNRRPQSRTLMDRQWETITPHIHRDHFIQKILAGKPFRHYFPETPGITREKAIEAFRNGPEWYS